MPSSSQSFQIKFSPVPLSKWKTTLSVSKTIQKNDRVYTRSNRSIVLQKVIGKPGTEGTVYSTNDNSIVCKIYHNAKLVLGRQEKLLLMTSRSISNPSICFPSDTVYDSDGILRGYLMPKAQGKSVQDLFVQPKNIKEHFGEWRTIDNVCLTLSILDKIKFLHSLNVFIGDYNPANFLVVDKDTVNFIDCDAYQVEDYPCPVEGPVGLFTAPEIQGADFETILRTRDHELFAVATLLFHILVPGVYPYNTGADPLDLLKRSEFPFADQTYSKIQGGSTGQNCKFWKQLDNTLQQLFIRTFHGNSQGKRPSIDEWLRALTQYEKGLVQCKKEPLHWYHSKNKTCPYCEAQERQRNAMNVGSSGITQQPISNTFSTLSLYTKQQRAKPNRVPSSRSLLQFLVNLEKRTRPQWESSWGKVFLPVAFITFWILFVGIFLIVAINMLGSGQGLLAILLFPILLLIIPAVIAFIGAATGAVSIGLLAATAYKFPRTFAGIFVCGALMLVGDSMFSQPQQHYPVPIAPPVVKPAVPVVSDTPVVPTPTQTEPKKDISKKDIFEIAEKGTVQDLRERLEGDGRMEWRVHMRDAQGATLLHRAAWHNKNVDVVEYLVSNGANIYTTDVKYGATPLHWAAENENIDVVKYLVSQGANVNAKNKNGMTPLDHAKRAGNTAMVEFLSNTFTRPSAQNNNTGSQLLTASVSFGVNATMDAAQNKYNDAKRAEEEVKNKWERLNRDLPSNYELSKLRNEVEQNEEISKLCQIRDWTYDGTNIIKGEVVAEFNGMIYLKDENENLLNKQKMKFSREDRTAIDKIGSFFQSHKELIPESVQRSEMPNSSGSLLRLHKEIVKNLDKKILNDKEKFETVEKQIKGAESVKKEYEEAKRKTEIAEQEYDAAKSNAAK